MYLTEGERTVIREIDRHIARAEVLAAEVRQFNEEWDRTHDPKVREHFEAERAELIDLLDGECE